MNEETPDNENQNEEEMEPSAPQEASTTDEASSNEDEVAATADETREEDDQADGGWEAPPLPEEIEAEEGEEAQMSEVSTLANIFFEPGKTFEDLRRKPRFIMAFVIIALLSTAFLISFNQRVGDERIKRFTIEQAEKNPQFAQLPEDQKERNIQLSLTIQRAVQYAVPLFIIIAFLIGSLIYWLGSKLMGGSAGFVQTLSVWVYSSLPPTVVSLLANFVVLFLKNPDDIDIATSSRGVIQANPSMLMDGKEMPVLTTLVSSIDLFAIWGWVLAAIGLGVVAKLSKGSAWGIVAILALFGITLRVIFSLINGIPQ